MFTWYCKDQELNASVFKKVSKTYFLKVLMRRAPPVRTHASQVWRERKNEVKLHRWLRFTKCTNIDDYLETAGLQARDLISGDKSKSEPAR